MDGDIAARYDKFLADLGDEPSRQLRRRKHRLRARHGLEADASGAAARRSGSASLPNLAIALPGAARSASAAAAKRRLPNPRHRRRPLGELPAPPPARPLLLLRAAGKHLAKTAACASAPWLPGRALLALLPSGAAVRVAAAVVALGGGASVFVETGRDGRVRRRAWRDGAAPSEKEARAVLTALGVRRGGREGAPCAVAKPAAPGAPVRLLATPDDVRRALPFGGAGGAAVVQAHVGAKSAGATGAWIVRAGHRRDGKTARGFVISDAGSEHATRRPLASAEVSIVTTAGGASWDGPKAALAVVHKALEERTGARLAELVGDFVEDAHKVWHLLQIKAYRLEDDGDGAAAAGAKAIQACLAGDAPQGHRQSGAAPGAAAAGPAAAAAAAAAAASAFACPGAFCDVEVPPDARRLYRASGKELCVPYRAFALFGGGGGGDPVGGPQKGGQTASSAAKSRFALSRRARLREYEHARVCAACHSEYTLRLAARASADAHESRQRAVKARQKREAAKRRLEAAAGGAGAGAGAGAGGDPSLMPPEHCAVPERVGFDVGEPTRDDDEGADEVDEAVDGDGVAPAAFAFPDHAAAPPVPEEAPAAALGGASPAVEAVAEDAGLDDGGAFSFARGGAPPSAASPGAGMRRYEQFMSDVDDIMIDYAPPVAHSAADWRQRVAAAAPAADVRAGPPAAPAAAPASEVEVVNIAVDSDRALVSDTYLDGVAAEAAAALRRGAKLVLATDWVDLPPLQAAGGAHSHTAVRDEVEGILGSLFLSLDPELRARVDLRNGLVRPPVSFFEVDGAAQACMEVGLRAGAS